MERAFVDGCRQLRQMKREARHFNGDVVHEKLQEKFMAFYGGEKNEWTISLLDLQKGDKVLEIGFGPGVAIQFAAKRIPNGYIVGVDYSDVILRQAQKRNATAIREGRVSLRLADISHLPSFDTTFDKVFSVNSIFFWPDPVAILKRVRQWMQPQGLIAITVQPYGGTDEDVQNWGKQITSYLNEAGFTEIRRVMKPMKPVASICVLGKNAN
jgi:ubiquinone/menaquinone biosynthesis C-methylase UbiE